MVNKYSQEIPIISGNKLYTPNFKLVLRLRLYSVEESIIMVTLLLLMFSQYIHMKHTVIISANTLFVFMPTLNDVEKLTGW